MQLIICSLIVLASALFVAKRWLPAGLKQRIQRLTMKNKTPANNAYTTGTGCSNCSSCGNCASDSTKIIQKVVFVHGK
jgi:hypothetical protein